MKETGWFVRCFQCGKQVDLGVIQRREALIQVIAFHYWFRFSPFNYRTYGMVDLCGACAAYIDETDSKRRRYMGALAIGSGVFLGGWGYLSAGIGLIGAAVTLALVMLLTRPKKIMLPAERNHS